MDPDRFARAVAAIDAANARDPNLVETAAGLRPKELVHAEMLTSWVRRLVPGPSEPLLLAARAHHIRRWERPRSEFPPGRGGYLRWRTGLYRFHAEQVAVLLERCGYDQATVGRVATLVAKRAGPGDPEGQALEDGLCLVFLETQLADVAARLDAEKMVNILRRTWAKMSPAAREQALNLPLDDGQRTLLARAVTGG